MNYARVSPVNSDEGIKTSCETANGGLNCASRVCTVETKFVKEIANWQIQNLANNDYSELESHIKLEVFIQSWLNWHSSPYCIYTQMASIAQFHAPFP